MQTDQIEKQILLRVSRQRIWRAIADSTEFGHWFGMKLDGPFVPGVKVRGVIAPTTVNAEVASAQKQYAGKVIEMLIDKMEPERVFSFRWHPHTITNDVDYSTEPKTVVQFTIADATDGVLLTVTESGFDQIPMPRGESAFIANKQGWAMIVKLIAEYLNNAH